VTTITELREVLAAVRCQGKRIGLVPTMGALHEGHLSLVRASQAECDFAVVSIYVNPSQFNVREDLEKYPRVLQADVKLLAACGAELLFAPQDAEVYAPEHATWINVDSVANPLEGECRPGHFRGVATIVLKLLNMVQPDVAYFGQKDYQQALVIRRMVEDLNVPVAIRVCPIVREADGLAMSSRNTRLSPSARRQATMLYKSIETARELVAQGEDDAGAIVDRMREMILTVEDARIDYVALVDPQTLAPVEKLHRPTLAALAVTIENTRLIDNCLLQPLVPSASGKGLG
jgi:pantoate--beta-alanine ligase